MFTGCLLHPIPLLSSSLFAFNTSGFSFYKLNISPALSAPYSLLSAFYSELFLNCSAKQLPSFGLNFSITAIFVSFSIRGTNASLFDPPTIYSPQPDTPSPIPGYLIPDHLITCSLIT